MRPPHRRLSTFRVLTLVDDVTREVPALKVASSVPGEGVVRVLDQLNLEHGLPETIVLDNGPEFTS